MLEYKFNIIKEYIDELSGATSDRVIDVMLFADELTGHEKRLIYRYLCPRPLGDYELIKRVAEEVKQEDTLVEIIVEAYRTEQYNKYLIHLFTSFCDPKLIYPVKGFGTGNCGICNRELSEIDKWHQESDTEELNNKYNMCWGSTNSSIVLCKKCIIALQIAKKILSHLEDKKYLK